MTLPAVSIGSPFELPEPFASHELEFDGHAR
jgi:hypothetical protein